MERVATLLWPLLGLTCVLLQLHATQGRWLGSVQQELPPCSPGGVPGFDCYDPPNHPLPPCDFNHQRIGFNCSGWPPASHVSDASPMELKSKSKAYPEAYRNGIGHVEQELPHCGPGGVPGFNCYDPPIHPLPPCDFNHQRIGFDCSGWPPASHVASHATFKSKSMAYEEEASHVQQELPPCGPGGVPGFDCYDPPNHPLPPCDFNHQRIGFDCSGWPPASHVAAASLADLKTKSMAHQPHGNGQVQQELPPCGPGSVSGFDCFNAPNHPLLPCDFHHQRIGFDCSGWPPASHVASPEAFKSMAHQQLGTGHVEQELPPCGPGGVPGFDCYDPPNHPLPPCDFNHQRIGFDCSGWPPAGGDSLDHHV